MPNILTGVTMEYAGDVSGNLIYQPLFVNPEFEQFFTILENVQYRTNLPVIGALQKITKKYVECGLTVSGSGTAISEREILPVRMESFLEHCADVFDGTIFSKLRKKGADINDVTGTEIESIIMNLVMAGLRDDIYRQVFFGDTDLADTDYNAYDGVWKTLMAGVDDYSITRTDSIGSGALAACDARDILRNLIRNSRNVLKQVPRNQAQILVTGSLFDNLIDCKIDTPYNPMVIRDLETGNGDVLPYETTQFEGYTVVAMRSWDTWIEADFSGEYPHRAILWVPGNHFIATDTASDYNKLKVWYSDDDDMNKTLARYMVSYNYALADLIAVAY